MLAYGIGILPLLAAAKLDDNDTKHAAFADDLAGVRKLRQIRQWWEYQFIWSNARLFSKGFQILACSDRRTAG